MIKRIARFIIFIICVYFIANSLLFAIGLAFYEKLSLPRCWIYFVRVFDQLGTFSAFFKFPWSPFIILIATLIIIYDCLILFYPAFLFWRHKTIIHAAIIAFVGSFMPPYVYIGFFINPQYIFYGELVMVAGYAAAYLSAPHIKRFAQIILRRLAHVNKQSRPAPLP